MNDEPVDLETPSVLSPAIRIHTLFRSYLKVPYLGGLVARHNQQTESQSRWPRYHRGYPSARNRIDIDHNDLEYLLYAVVITLWWLPLK
ncbi:hypothetical protein PIIN_08438 [Serendipita indica DSM 11827]|uniref:Uncharacterized protein n=1 Tax=Serendipita indica (strain DSM 11827) TaxID=1109443 RepID=G4TT44_SERID|nr:hypothetical protein PIIN_08438 [Serendipita indica DSM 11827]